MKKFVRLTNLVLGFLATILINNSASGFSVSGFFNDAGYETVNFDLGTKATVNMQVQPTSFAPQDYFDAGVVLFDGNGQLIFAGDDDQFGRYANLTQNLMPGNYSAIVTSTAFIPSLLAFGGQRFGTDGFSLGYFYGGGTMTRLDLTTYLDRNPSHGGKPFLSRISGSSVSRRVPDGGSSIALFGLVGVFGLGLGRKFRNSQPARQ